MNCDRALEQMSAMLDGELTAEESEQLQAHLDACQSCRAVYAELAAVDAAVAADQAEPPEALRENVMHAIRSEQKHKPARRTRSYVTAGLIAAAALALVVLSGLGVVQLPGFGDEGRASVSVGQSMQAILPSDQPATGDLKAKYAAQIANEHGCAVLVVWNCAGLDELQDVPFETLDDGARLYLTDGATLDAILERCREQYPMGLYTPEADGRTGGDAPAYLMIFS